MPLPPGVSRKDFDSAVKEFEAIVGKEWVFASDEDAALYRDAYSVYMGEEEDPWASGGVAPTTVEQVQSIVHVANKYKIPIYAISTGKNLGMGGSAPNYSGSFCVDLKRMNKILEIDEVAGTCLVEPGVTYFDLYNHIQENNLNLWISCPDPGWGSVIGNAVDHGQGHTSTDFRDHFDSHCGMEAVLPNGDILRTGMGAMPNSPNWQRYKYGLGPSLDGLFNQSNMGIVTKMGFYLKHRPETMLQTFVDVPRYEDLIPLIDIHTYLQNSGMANGAALLISPSLRRPYMVTRFLPDLADGELKDIISKGVDPKDLQQWVTKNNVPYWRYRIVYFGPEKVVRAEWEHTKDVYSAAIKGVSFVEEPILKFPLSEDEIMHAERTTLARRTEFGIPNLDAFAAGARRPDNPNPIYGEIWVAPKIPKTGEAVLKAHEVFGDVFKRHNFPYNGWDQMPQVYSKRVFDMIYFLNIYNDVEKNKKTRIVYEDLLNTAAEQGWSDYRVPLAFQKHAMDMMSFGNHAHRRTIEAFKDAIDPNGIMANGRYNIWSKHLREENS